MAGCNININKMLVNKIIVINSLINAPGAMTDPQGIHSSCGGHFHLPGALCKAEDVCSEESVNHNSKRQHISGVQYTEK